MSKVSLKAKILRFDPQKDEESRYQTYEVPLTEEMTILDVLDYIYEKLDGTIAYYDHAACGQGVCGRCSVMMNGKPVLACQTTVKGDMCLAPLSNSKIIRDLVCEPRNRATIS